MNNEIKKFFDNLDNLNVNLDISFFLENVIKKYFDKKYSEVLQIANELAIIAFMGKNIQKAFPLFEKERLAATLTYDTYSYVAAYFATTGIDIEKLSLKEALIIIGNTINLNTYENF